ncbi:helix-turn-helix transcriptional regulator [Mucisphaera sp.]|uniref:helix-turn-helix transcriptional regulator n=1 Tax=Mucisphaera sp. TaxID=2913024 RepID=UPI003D0DE3D7
MKKAKLRITNTIRRLRFDADEMTQQDLADRAGCTRQTIAAIEKAKYAPSLELAILIAHALGQPLAAVFQAELDGQSVPLSSISGGTGLTPGTPNDPPA